MSIQRIKVKDTVIAIAGEAAGKTGVVQRIDHRRGRAIVEGLNLVKKAFRPGGKRAPSGGLHDIEAPIALSNLMPYDPKQKKGVRIARVREGGAVVREAKGSGHRFE